MSLGETSSDGMPGGGKALTGHELGTVNERIREINL